MITEHDLAEAIAECEGQRNPSSSTCLKLAAFYTIRDKMFADQKQVTERKIVASDYSMASVPDTEFMKIVSDLSTGDVMPIMDELMSTLQALMPKLYDGVIRKLEKIKY